MKIVPLDTGRTGQVRALLQVGGPFVTVRTPSDYWLYATLFSSTCPIALIEDVLVGAIIAFRSQDDPDDIYVQDVMTHPDHRRRGVARALIATIRTRARQWGCRRLFLTSDPANTPAHHTWTALGFTNVPGTQSVAGISVITDYKGPGQHRAVYELSP